jgi:serine/threonine protein kinase
MAFAPPLIDSGHAADAFAEALNGMAVGIVSLAFARRALASACADNSGASENLRELILQARQAGRLNDDTCATLLTDLDQGQSEDEPTEWSREAARSSAQPRAPSSPAATLSPGVILRDRFVLEQRLDTNGMCEVYRALDRRRREAGADSASVTIKLVSPATPRHEDALRLLQHEAALAPRLEHPNIARVFDFDRDGNIAFITREWLDGRSLAELMDRQRHRPLDPETCARILVAIADALRFAHSRGVVHADVKPGNIVLTGDGTAKLIDFGIARVDSGRVDGATTGARTPAYSSCEALEGQAATPQDDLFALACIAYRMYAGHRAFGNEDALTAERDGHPPARIVKLDDPQWQALERALAFRREERTRDIDTFLREFLGTAAGSAEAPRARDFPAPAIPRAPWVVAGGAMAVLLLAVALWPAADAPPNAETAASARLPPVTPVLPPLPVPVPTSTAAFQEEPAAQGAAAPAVTTVSAAEPPRRKLLPDAAPPQAAATTGAAPAAPGKVAVRPASPSAPLPGEAAVAGAPGPAEVVRVD